MIEAAKLGWKGWLKLVMAKHIQVIMHHLRQARNEPRIITRICIRITISAGRRHLVLPPVKSTTLIQIIYIKTAMKNRINLRRGGQMLAFLILPGFFNACTDHDDPKPVITPADHIQLSENLTMPKALSLPQNPKGYERVATYFAVGVQKYKAQVKAGVTPVQYEWVFVAPQADLYDASNAKIGIHYAGPTWKLTGPGHTIMGQAFSPAITFSSDPKSIDWLLLSNKAGQEPTGTFQGVGYIFRIATKGGKAPATPPAEADATVEVPYTAVYRFVKRIP